MSDALRLRLLTLVLRLSGGFLLLAFVAVFIPVSWMEAGHAMAKVGPFPESPIYVYLARSIAALYGFHGLLVLIVSTDLVRYRPLTAYLGWLNVTFGIAMTVIDVTCGIPLWWTLMEGPAIAVTGAAILALRGAIPPYRGDA